MPQELRKRHKGHARSLKHLEERYEWYADAIELEPADHKGTWLADFMPQAHELRLDLGCGKGSFTVAEALAHPDILFIGLDYSKPSIAQAAQKAIESGAKNVIFTLADAEDLADLFAAGEIERIYLNFPTPHPRRKHAKERLTYVDALLYFRPLLPERGEIFFKTDSQPLFDFSLIQFDLAGFELEYSTRDLHEDHPELPTSDYEERLCAQGAKVHACLARKGPAPNTPIEQSAELSLFEYLPDDLESLDYVPFGMSGYVNQQLHIRAKQAQREQQSLG
ncbi:MAG: tRNA (guanosine(46)-N7)-methyltransferase TrmB [Coriobacteriales bacterium]|jgi:tRNA (guanine-N7-)-methyltransferase